MNKQIPPRDFRAAKVDFWQTRPPQLDSLDNVISYKKLPYRKQYGTLVDSIVKWSTSVYQH